MGVEDFVGGKSGNEGEKEKIWSSHIMFSADTL
jgi:hypothetical protein